jgi:peptidoglycan-associated lipoprotein
MRLSITLATFVLTLSACSTTRQAIKEPADPSAAELARSAAMAEMMRNFERVRFEFDSAQITEDTRDALAANAQIMRNFSELELEVEGHCDEQGSTEYNLSLGQRRADAIQKYLVQSGVPLAHVRTISYGEERPIAFGSDPGSYALNRRAEFRITVDPNNVARGTVDALVAAR